MPFLCRRPKVLVCVAPHLIVDFLPVHRWQYCRPDFEVVLPEIWNLDLGVGTSRFGISELLVVRRGLLATRILDVVFFLGCNMVSHVDGEAYDARIICIHGADCDQSGFEIVCAT